MNILINSIIDKSEELNYFFKQFHGGNYVVYGDLILFDYEGDEKKINLQDIRIIYMRLSSENSFDSVSKEDAIEGEMILTDWTNAVEEIDKALRYAPKDEGWQAAEDMSLDIVTDSEHENRKKTFWKIIQNNFELPPQYVYRLDSDYPSYFSMYVMWGFCYIILKDGKGLILYAGASD